jgi:hypothetical protein
MRKNVNRDRRAESTNISIFAVALPSFSAVGEKGVLGDFDLYAFLGFGESIPVVFDVTMLRHRSFGILLSGRQTRPKG